MKRLAKKLKNKSGQALVVVALSIVALAGFAAMAVDLGSVYVSDQKMQNAADMAALAAAYELPDVEAAIATAEEYALQNGVEEYEITTTTPYNGDEDAIEVICQKNVQYTFARVLGFTDADVVGRAVAKKQGGEIGGPFQYAIFAGSSNALVTLGSSCTITGSVHSNGSVKMGSSNSITGNLEAVGNIKMASSNVIGGTCQGGSINASSSNDYSQLLESPAATIDMPDFTEQIRQAAAAAGQEYIGDKTYSGNTMPVNSPIYIDGDLTVNGSSFQGIGIVLVTGNIEFNGSSSTMAGSSVCFYSANGNIDINGSSSKLEGLIYAPNGCVDFSGSSQTINGRVVAQEVEFNGSSNKVTTGDDDLVCMQQFAEDATLLVE